MGQHLQAFAFSGELDPKVTARRPVHNLAGPARPVQRPGNTSPR